MNQNDRLLCFCCSFPPEVTPTSIRSGKILSRLSAHWSIDVITAVENGGEGLFGNSGEGGPKCTPPAMPQDCITVHTVKATNRFGPLLERLARYRLDKIPSWFIWPDDQVFWVRPALRAARARLERRPAGAIVVFMMPYSAGLAGILLKRKTGLPLVLNLDDSLTCTDMHPFYSTRLHYLLSRKLEDWFVRQADAVIYVSQFNLEMVRARQRPQDRTKFHLVRYGADPVDYRVSAPEAQPADSASPFRIVYLGGMSGWFEFYHAPGQTGIARRLYRFWVEWGRYERLRLDQRGSSPVYIGRAALAAAAEHPEWRDRIRVDVHGNKYPPDVVARVLENTGLKDVVTVSGSVPNAEAIRLAQRADLLFMALPARSDGSPGGRISAKTYEYLMTDRPILAAIPRGENRDYLEGKPGVWVVDPDDVAGMQSVISVLAAARFAGCPLTYDRSALRDELSYDTKAAEFDVVIRSVVRQQATADRTQGVAQTPNT